MPLTADSKALTLSRNLLAALDKGNGGIHPGFRANHAKGILLDGTFTAAAAARSLTRAAHVQRPSVPVTVRFSDFSGIPTVADFAGVAAVPEPPNASPRGCAIRFNLAEHVHTDIIGHSIDAFPTHTPAEFLEFVKALLAHKAGSHDALAEFFKSHPAALAFSKASKPIPTSFAREWFFSVSACKFTNSAGVSRYGRYRVLPEAGTDYLSPADAAKQRPNFLFDEIGQRIAKGPAKFKIKVQIAEDADKTDDATARWPETRSLVNFGEISLNQIAPENNSKQQQIIFDPIPRIEGIEPSADPLFEARANVYLMSGKRRRAASA